jgi:hypothetical protein
VRDDPFTFIAEHREKIVDKFNGWELIEFLQIPTEDVLDAMYEFGWLDDDNIEDFVDFIGLKDD